MADNIVDRAGKNNSIKTAVETKADDLVGEIEPADLKDKINGIKDAINKKAVAVKGKITESASEKTATEIIQGADTIAGKIVKIDEIEKVINSSPHSFSLIAGVLAYILRDKATFIATNLGDSDTGVYKANAIAATITYELTRKTNTELTMTFVKNIVADIIQKGAVTIAKGSAAQNVQNQVTGAQGIQDEAKGKKPIKNVVKEITWKEKIKADEGAIAHQIAGLIVNVDNFSTSIQIPSFLSIMN